MFMTLNFRSSHEDHVKFHFMSLLQECKQLGFDTIELNANSLEVPEDTLLRYVRMIKNGGLRAKPIFAVKFNKSDIPGRRNRAFGSYVVPEPRSSGKKHMVLLVRAGSGFWRFWRLETFLKELYYIFFF